MHESFDVCKFSFQIYYHQYESAAKKRLILPILRNWHRLLIPANVAWYSVEVLLQMQRPFKRARACHPNQVKSLLGLLCSERLFSRSSFISTTHDTSEERACVCPCAWPCPFQCACVRVGFISHSYPDHLVYLMTRAAAGAWGSVQSAPYISSQVYVLWGTCSVSELKALIPPNCATKHTFSVWPGFLVLGPTL